MRYKRSAVAIGFLLLFALTFFVARSHFYDGYPTIYWTYMLRHSDVAETRARLVAGRDRAVPILLHLLWDQSDSYHRVVAAGSLGRIGPDAETAIPDLVRALKDRDYVVRGDSASALRQIGVRNSSVVAGLRELLSDETDFVRIEAAKGILELAPEYSAEVRAALVEASQHGMTGDQEAAQRILNQLDKKETNAKSEARPAKILERGSRRLMTEG